MDASLYFFVGIILFLVVLFILLIFLLLARKKLVSDKLLDITINNSKKIQTSYSTKIIDSLSNNNIYLPSACGGGGSCGMCKLKILSNSSCTPIDKSLISKDLLDKGYRLACQYSVKNDVSIEIPNSIMSVKKRKFKVISNIQMTDLIHEIRFVPDDNEKMFEFIVGDYIQVEYLKDDEKYIRGYSMVNCSSEKEELILNVRLAIPPRNTKFPVGVVSSYLTSRKKEDPVYILGPYGEFHIKENSEEECLYIAGGVGLASIRAHVFELLKCMESKRKISLWYGIRGINDGYYIEEFTKLAKKYENFSYNIVLSNESLDGLDPKYKDSCINFYEGFVHDACYNNYLKDHLDPCNINYYFCGPSIMNQKIYELLKDLGVSKDNIFCDDFGS